MLKLLKKRNKGFTLVELLVVIAIIAILAIVALINLSKVPAQARDAQRKNDLATVQTALEKYNIDHAGFPMIMPGMQLSMVSSSLVPNYLPKIPVDPRNGHNYIIGANVHQSGGIPTAGDQYQVATTLETKNDSLTAYTVQNWANNGLIHAGGYDTDHYTGIPAGTFAVNDILFNGSNVPLSVVAVSGTNVYCHLMASSPIGGDAAHLDLRKSYIPSASNPNLGVYDGSTTELPYTF